MKNKTGGYGSSLGNLLIKPELIIGVAAIILIIGSFAPWFRGIDPGWIAGNGGTAVGLLGGIMLYTSIVNIFDICIMSKVFPVSTVSLIAGLTSFFIALGAWLHPLGGAWGLYLIIMGSIISFLAFLLAFTKNDCSINLRKSGL